MDQCITDETNILCVNLLVSPSAKAFIKTTGFRTLRDLLNVQPLRISRELGMDPHKVVALIDEIRDCASANTELKERKRSRSGATGTTALALLDRSKALGRHIITYCHALDEVLGGGLTVGEVTELCGVPGSGKTQLAMQLSVDVCIPPEFGGLGNECLYIDTEGSFAVERVRDMITAVQQHLERVASLKKGIDQTLRLRRSAVLKDMNLESIMKKILYCRVHTHSELIAIVFSLNNILETRPTIKLVVIDSIAFHFRQEFDNMALRTRLLNTISQSLNSIAANNNLAVLVTNQMTTKIANDSPGSKSNSDSSYFVPALGESWSHAITSRLVVERTKTVHTEKPKCMIQPENTSIPEVTINNTVRKISLIKSPYLRSTSCSFIITKSGIRDVKPKINVK